MLDHANDVDVMLMESDVLGDMRTEEERDERSPVACEKVGSSTLQMLRILKSTDSYR